MGKLCLNCGTQNRDIATFCKYCGALVLQLTEQPVQAQPALEADSASIPVFAFTPDIAHGTSSDLAPDIAPGCAPDPAFDCVPNSASDYTFSLASGYAPDLAPDLAPASAADPVPIKKSKKPLIVGGSIGIVVIALTVVMITTNMFGLLSSSLSNSSGKSVVDQPHALSDGEQGYYTGILINGNAEDDNGKFVFGNGNIYTGNFKDNNLNGQGTLKWSSGSIYVGGWKDGLREGKGTMTDRNGNTYDGEWKNGAPDGYGKMTYFNGAVYEGEWKDGKWHGKGAVISEDGSVLNGYFENGEFVKK